jgi:hypothetical protein
VGHWHHFMACPVVESEIDGLQMSRVAMNEEIHGLCSTCSILFTLYLFCFVYLKFVE